MYQSQYCRCPSLPLAKHKGRSDKRSDHSVEYYWPVLWALALYTVLFHLYHALKASLHLSYAKKNVILLKKRELVLK